MKKLVGLLTAAVAILIGSSLVSGAPGDGEMSPECAYPPVAGQCVYPIGDTFSVWVNVVSPDAGYDGVQLNLDWDESVLSYQPAADPINESVWGECTFAAGYVMPDTSLLWTCLPQPPLVTPSLYEGPVAEFSFTCDAEGTSDMALLGFGGSLDSLFYQTPGIELGPDVLGSIPITCAPDTDDDGVPDPVDVDDDNDGCQDTLDDDPTDFWDFFDTPDAGNYRDGAIASEDIFRVISRFGSSGDPLIDPLTEPALSGYHTAFDRTYVGPWTGPANGSVSGLDLFMIIAQFGRQC